MFIIFSETKTTNQGYITKDRLNNAIKVKDTHKRKQSSIIYIHSFLQLAAYVAPSKRLISVMV